MRVLGIVALMALAPAATAWAQTAPPYWDALHMLPMPANKAENCAAFWPGAPLAAGASGTTDLTIHIGGDGAISNAQVLVSSGDPKFDAAAIACADAFFIQPPTRDGERIAIDWVGRINWNRPPQATYLSIALQDERRRVCLNFPALARRLDEQGTAAIVFIVGEDGSTKDFKVAHSAGFRDLDQAEIGCFSLYKYFPPTLGGKPTEIEWRAVQNFVLH